MLAHAGVQAALGNFLAAVIPRARIVPAVRGEDMSADQATVRFEACVPALQQSTIVVGSVLSQATPAKQEDDCNCEMHRI